MRILPTVCIRPNGTGAQWVKADLDEISGRCTLVNMSALEVALWVVVLVASVFGIAAKDWRACAITLGCAVFALVMMIVHAWR